jgi:hypothetical protein
MKFPIIAAGLVLLAILAPFARAADATTEPDQVDQLDPGSGEEFSLRFRSYAWFAGLVGDVGVKGIKTHVDDSFLDVIDNTDTVAALFVRLDARYGAWGGYVESGYMGLGVDNIHTPIGKADDSFTLIFTDLALTYRLIDTPRTASSPGLSVSPLAGLRYMHLGNELNPDLLDKRKQTKDWADPIVGAEAVVTLSDHWRVLLHGDIGGFGVSSDLTWSAFALGGYRFKLGRRDAEILLGYKALAEDYTDGSGNNEFTWDTTLHGPVFAFNIRF